MKAAFYERQGAAHEVLTIGDIPRPEPGPGEVLVRIAASGVNPVDGYLRAGALWPMEAPRIVPGFDGAGVIEAVGPGVRRDRGERVWLYNARWQRAFGTAAEYIALPASLAVRLPDRVSFEQGAVIGVAARTAYAALFSDGPIEGQTILVAGGAGTTAYAAIQLAKWRGARVIATVSSDEKAAAARGAGADHVIDYKREQVAAIVAELTSGRGVDRIVEVAFAANVALDSELVREGGVIAAYGSAGNYTPTLPLGPLMFKRATLRLVNGFALDERGIADITAALEADALRALIWRVLPLDRAAEAHAAQDAELPIGKIVLTPT